MNRLFSTVLGAGLALVLAGSACADSFTITRTTDVGSIARGGISVNFTGLGVPTPPANSDAPGTSQVLLNYTVTTDVPEVPTEPVEFNDDFTLSILLTDLTEGGATHTSVFNGHISGNAKFDQDNLIIDLTPANADATVFDINYTRFTIGQLQATLPPGVNDTANPGAISARISSVPVPEPGSMALLGAGLLPALGLLRRRR